MRSDKRSDPLKARFELPNKLLMDTVYLVCLCFATVFFTFFLFTIRDKAALLLSKVLFFNFIYCVINIFGVKYKYVLLGVFFVNRSF